jgi:RNA polymerase sigma-70 factor (ECF subfamily)
MLHDRSSAEDMVQEAFVQLVKAADRIEGGGTAVRVWLFKSVRFRCLDELRRRKRHAVPSHRIPDRGVDDPPVVSPDPRLTDALGELSDRHRALLVMRHVVGLSGEEIAAVTGTTRTAVYGALGRAERKLRSALTRAGYHEGEAR